MLSYLRNFDIWGTSSLIGGMIAVTAAILLGGLIIAATGPLAPLIIGGIILGGFAGGYPIHASFEPKSDKKPKAASFEPKSDKKPKADPDPIVSPVPKIPTVGNISTSTAANRPTSPSSIDNTVRKKISQSNTFSNFFGCFFPTCLGRTKPEESANKKNIFTQKSPTI